MEFSDYENIIYQLTQESAKAEHRGKFIILKYLYQEGRNTQISNFLPQEIRKIGAK